jgi:glycosyltransferase involved in cell wall biosynthesis
MDSASIKYIIISPVRNEEKNIEYTLNSVISQTIKPTKWIIVDDGSSDRTPEIIQEYAMKNNWIRLIQLADRGYYDLMEASEIKAFYKGYQRIENEDYDYLSKLDGDISFDQNYYENLFTEFRSNSRLGVASGGLYYLRQDNEQVPEPTYKKHPRGGARVYRKKCWQDIGGVEDKLSWDAIDVYKARMRGWDTYTFDYIKARHHVKTWKKGGLFQGFKRAGRLQYLMGSHYLFFGALVVKKVFAKPYFLGACAVLYGYLKSYISKEDRVAEPKLMNYIRREQLKRLRFYR